MTFHPPTPETPAGWRHVRIQHEGRRYSLRTSLLNLPFNAVDLAAMKLTGEKTEGVTLATAKLLGQVIETWMVGQEPDYRKRKPRNRSA